MSIFRTALTTFSVVLPRLTTALHQKPQPLLGCQLSVMLFQPDRRFSKQTLSKNLDLLTASPVKLSKIKLETQLTPSTTVITTDRPRPLVVMLAWMLARHKHLAKYAQIYLQRGYDVLTVSITPWQLLWPVKGCQLVADEVVQFLDYNKSCQPIILHGFSVGGYVWGEVMVRMKDDMPRYQPILDRIVGQTWDSAADVTEISIGLPLAVFPNNPIVRTALEKYVRYHLKTFHDAATIHYLRASQLFHTTLVKAPALLLVSEMDPVGSAASNKRLKETWESMGVKMYWKCWEDSKHVSHFLKYRDEYTEILERFLDSISSSKEEEHVKINEKLQAKL